jgi:NADH dehydrogenase/NADH:ubiquinone oxidoreductase subunit G
MSNTITLTIDGQQLSAEAGQTVLEAAQAAGIQIPTLCHHPALAPIGACRVCLIEISKFQPLYPACAYQVMEGLKVETRSERVEKARRFVLDLLFSERNHFCMYCEMSGNCELQDLGYEYGLDHWVYPTYTERFPVDATRDTFLMDHNRCVLCRRCVRACGELVANHTLGERQRGAKTMISADLDVPFGDSSCIECGTCLQVCPTGALIDKRSAFMGMGRNVELERVKSTCSQCSVGCGIEIVVRGGNVLRVDGDWEASPNGGVLCQKGRFAPLCDKRQRLTAPLLRRNGKQEVVDWAEALEAVIQQFGGIPTGKLGALASTHATNEALYLLNKLFREALGAKTGLLNRTLHRLLVTHGALAQIADSDMLVVVGVDPVEEQPVASFLVKRAVDGGARLIVVDGPGNGLAPFADMIFEIAHLDKAVDVARRADSPVVLYGAGVTGAELAMLKLLDKATFITLEPGVNTRAAVAYELDGALDSMEAEAVYVLLGEEPWDGATPVADGAFLVVQASYLSPLTERADVVLPTAIWSEQSGTLTNLEGQVQQLRRAVLPQGTAKADWEILWLLAEVMGKLPTAFPEEWGARAAQELW